MSKNDCRVSVVVTTYNRKYEVRRALDSVYAQIQAPFEVILVDDASIDGTKEYIENFHFPGLKYLYLENIVGIGAARNIGIRNAKGEFVAFLNSDNEWKPSKLKIFEEKILGSEAAVDLWCSKYDQHIGFETYEWPLGFNSYEQLLEKEVWVHSLVDASATIFRKSFLEEINGFLEELAIYMDWELLLRARRKRELCIQKIDQVLSDHWDMSERPIKDMAADQKERFSLMVKYEKEIMENDLYFYYFKEYAQYLRQITGGCDELRLFQQIYDASHHKAKWLSVFHQQSVREKRQLENSLFRKNKFYAFLYDWMNLKLSDDSIGERLIRRGYQRIAIYGAGKHGILLYKDLCVSNVEIVYFIDKNKTIEKEINIPVFTIDEELPTVDCIVISLFLEASEIKQDLEKVITCDMIALDELVKK